MKHLMILAGVVALQGYDSWKTSHSHSSHQVHTQQDAQRES